MKNTFGQSIALTLFGESHGPAVGAVIDGLAPGIRVDEKIIAEKLSKRRPSGEADTARKEPDDFRILSGVFNGKTTGTPICIVIPNVDTKSKDYTYGPARPSHADYAAYCKYHGYEDYRGGGHFSGRITAALVAAGGILAPALGNLGIRIGTHILKCGAACDRAFGDIKKDLEQLDRSCFPVLDKAKEKEITEEILKAKEEEDSVGGITQTAVIGLPKGLGEPWFDSLESLISHVMFSIGGIKGIEFGAGFGFASMRGHESNDAFYMNEKEVASKTNHSGGINGGISNGMPVLFQCAVKPTASIARPQDTIDFLKNEDTKISIKGRHDPAIIRRICPVIDAAAALVIADALACRYGTDFLAKEKQPWTLV